MPGFGWIARMMRFAWVGPLLLLLPGCDDDCRASSRDLQAQLVVFITPIDDEAFRARISSLEGRDAWWEEQQYRLLGNIRASGAARSVARTGSAERRSSWLTTLDKAMVDYERMLEPWGGLPDDIRATYARVVSTCSGGAIE